MAGSTNVPSSWGTLSPEGQKWWNGLSAENKASYNVHAGINNNNHPSTQVGWKGPAGKTSQQPAPALPWAQPQPTQPAQRAGDLSYQSGVTVGGGIQKGGILSGLLATGNQPDPNVSAFARATSRNDASQLGRAIDAQNQELMMGQQAKRSESVVAGASNAAKIYGDMAERGISQTGLAAQIAANNIGFAGGLQAAFNPYDALKYRGLQ